MDTLKYKELIEKIKKKRNRVNAITIIVALLILFFAGPTHIVVLDKTVLAYKGLPLVVVVLLIILWLFIGMILYAIVSLPLTTSMDNECDPEKHLILNTQLNKQKDINHIYTTDYFYLGDYETAIKHAELMIATKNEQKILAGLFARARCEFLLENCDTLSKIATEYENRLSNCKKINAKAKEVYLKINPVLSLMQAILTEDRQKIDEVRNSIETWNASKATEGFVNYLKGVAAYKVEDREEAIYRFKSVKEDCLKTILAELSDKYLLLLR